MARPTLRRARSHAPDAAAGEPANAFNEASPAGTDTGAAASATTVAAPPTVRADPAGPLDRVRASTPVGLLRTARPGQSLAVAGFLAVCAALADRPPQEALLVGATVLVGQVVLAWHEALMDRERDVRQHTPSRPLADGTLDPGSAWFALACGVLLLVPLASASGRDAAIAYLASVAVLALGERALRRGGLSWLPWAASWGLLPAFLAYGGWGGVGTDTPPEIGVTVLFALLGIGVHLVRSVWGLVSAHAEGWRSLPLRVGLRLGASRLLTVSALYCAVVLVVLALVAASTGLTQG